jgi:hypothetical protein
MSYWRKLFLVVLLALSLPVQSFAAVSMKCVPSHFGAQEVFAQHTDLPNVPHLHGVTRAGGADLGDANHAQSCSACASCCFGVAFPVVPAVPSFAGAVHFAVPFSPSAGVALFLTDGIERPPRISLV